MKNVALVLVVALLLAVGCGGTGNIVETDQPAVADTVADWAKVDAETVPEPDVVEPDVPLPEEILDFGPIEDVGPACKSGEGCFLDPCSAGTDCLSGWCVDLMGESVCTIQCTEECPAGWSCKPVSDGGPDLTYVCVSNTANLCRPCATGDNCKSPAGKEDVCLDYGKEGSFCGAQCTTGADCPWGFSCIEAVTVDGASTKQCVADAGVCPCTKKSVDLALWTPCSQGNEAGKCEGKRFCTAEGLSDCDAPVPAEETCDGLDNDCNGDVDEPTLVDGKSKDLCDDGNACTDDACSGAAGCTHEALDQGECLDGDACTIGDHCSAGQCVGLPIVCDDDDPCTDDACDGLGGCSSTQNAAPCDDGNPCTVADQCAGGKCEGTSVPCDCQADEDCAALEDGDLCNGTLRCQLDKWPYLCTVDAKTVVICPQPPAGKDAICLVSACDPATGGCSLAPDHDGFACDDGDPCTVGEKCAQGACSGGVAATCTDDNPCTDDVCQPGVGCMFTMNTASCSDGNVCTSGDVCSGGKCVGGPLLKCDDGNACNGVETCDVAKGCQPGMFLVCDDGNACNGIEKCVPATGCVAGIPTVCDDGDPCTDDACDPVTGCSHVANQAPCDDGNACTQGDNCQAGKCVPAGSTVCNDGNLCTTDNCDPVQGCLFLVNQNPCDDGDVCTTGDHCQLGQCTSSGKLTCADSNPCTKDACNPLVGCQFTPIAGTCNDSNACTADDHCENGQCLSSVLTDCDDANPCTKDSCLPASGCKHVAQAGSCEDGTECSVGDTCDNGVCVPGPPLACDDGNACTSDVCDPVLGCVYKAVVGGCDDGNPCTDGDKCVGTVCTAGPPKDCDDANVCTTDTCDPAKLCVNMPKSGACDDGDACTNGDQCVAGKCTAGPALNCDDGAPCTTDGCEPQSGCFHTPFAPCCGNNVIEPGEQCDDGNQISGDGCEANCVLFTAVDVTFTNCSQTGPTGPNQSQCNSAYAGNPQLAGKVTVNSGVQTWTVPYTGTYRIEAYGAKGGGNGGNGARMRGDFQLQQGTVLKIIVGQMGSNAPASVGNGGGGGSFVARQDNTALIVAGGGGGTGHGESFTNYENIGGRTDTSGANGMYYPGSGGSAGGTNGSGGGVSHTTGNGTPNGAGGGGFTGNGGTEGAAKGGAAFVNGGSGGNSTGGFGGGGGSDVFIYGCGLSPHGGSGGGGYSGGGAGGSNCNGAGGGGGSYNNGSNPSNSAAANGTHGKIQITRL